MFSKKAFSGRIKQLRKEKKISQAILAEYLEISRTQISDLENGKTSTSVERLYMLADYFNVSIDYLVGRSDEPKRY
ncbi:MAG: helix-turn-helix transcriptional regulator [Oscillospiraceae bacterium]|nr:helix-turn-helix transcriptional regulator [Oscillospiraceae bacterium]